MSLCSSCGAEILWVTMPSGKSMPVDIIPTMVVVLSSDNKRGTMRRGHISHFATCPNAGQHRKGKTT